jgi:hypothetical protein
MLEIHSDYNDEAGCVMNSIHDKRIEMEQGLITPVWDRF